MTAPHDMSSDRPRSPLRMLLTGAVVVGLLAMFGAGVLSFLPGGLGGLASRADPPEADGKILWTSEDLAVQLGPGGWLTHPGEGGAYVARNVRTGESWTVGDLASSREITADGVVLQGEDGKILIQREGSTLTATTQQILRAVGDADLWPGEDSEFLGVSEEHVAVVTCLAPKPARLHEEVEGGRRVVAGVDLEDASIGWTHDTGTPCGPLGMPQGYPDTLPAQSHLFLEPTEGEIEILDLDTGKVVRRASGAKSYHFTIQGDHLLARTDEDTVTWSSLRTGKEIAEVSCTGAGVVWPSGTARQLSPEAIPYATCHDGVRVLDGDRFVTVDAQQPDLRARIADGEEVALGHLLLRREGEAIHVEDVLTGSELADLDVPQDYVVGSFVPHGRLIAFAKWEEDGPRPTASYRVFDATTGDLVLRTGPGMRAGAEASPDGVVIAEADDEDVVGTRLWAAGTKGEQ